MDETHITPGPPSPGAGRQSSPLTFWQPPAAEELRAQIPAFEISEMLGCGGMGAVYKGWQVRLERHVAIKILPANMAGLNVQAAEAFQQEARTLAKFQHPGIVGVFDTGETATGMLYIVMEYVEGTDVAQMVQLEGRLLGAHALAITAQVCDALQYAHSHGVVHCDIKPANIMVDLEGSVKVTDFGLAKLNEADENGLTKSCRHLGTADYIAPESLIRGIVADGRADLYALGVTLYYMLTGELPRGRFLLPSVKVGADPRLDAILQRALQADRARRYQSALEMRQDVERLLVSPLAGESPPLPSTSPRQPLPQKPRDRPPSVGGVGGDRWVESSPLREHEAGNAKLEEARTLRAVTRTKRWLGPLVLAMLAALAIGGFLLRPGAGARHAGSPPFNATKEHPYVNSLGMKFVPVPIAGGPVNGPHIFFCIWNTRVKDFRAFMEDSHYDYSNGMVPTTLGEDGWKPREGGSWSNPGFEQGDDHPVTCVSWEDAKAFCAWLSKKEGREYRLPGDHEWSCAVGIGSQEPVDQGPKEKNGKITDSYAWGAAWPPPARAGNFAGSESKTGHEPKTWAIIQGYQDPYPRTSPAGAFDANSLGIFDLAGNVWEWCEDWYDATHGARVLRGGSWTSNQNQLRSSRRDYHLPTFRNDNHGFRVVLVLK